MTAKEYYAITTDEVGTFPEDAKIKTEGTKTDELLFKLLAYQMTEEIDANEDKGEPTVFILPVGPVGQYEYFVNEVNEDNISLENCWFINMDEYLNDDNTYIDINSPLSFRGFMQREVYSKIKPELLMPESQRIFPDPEDPEKVDNLLKKLGGATMCIGGIGLDGHIAFNEPMPKLKEKKYMELPTRIVELSETTRLTNGMSCLGGAIDMMPHKAITIGMKEILASGKIRLGVFREWHKAVVRRAVYGDISTEFPVTLLQNHPDTLIYVSGLAGELPYETGTV